MTRDAWIALAVIMAVVGPLLAYRLATHRERFRRVRRDVKTQWRGLRTLVKMLRHEGWALTKTGVIVFLLAAVVVGTVSRVVG